MLNITFKNGSKLIQVMVCCFSLLGCYSTISAKESLLVFAAIGARQPLMEIADRFEKKFDTEIVYDFGGTGRLANKVFIGQKPDVFIAGSEKWVVILKERGYIDGYHPIARHTPVFIVSKHRESIHTLEDILQKEYKVALGNPKACAIGATSQSILSNLGIDQKDINLSAYGTTVKQLVFWVESGVADISIVWHADAVQSGKVRILPIPEEKNAPSFIPICLMKTAEDKQMAKAFVSYVLEEGKGIFESHGFQI